MRDLSEREVSGFVSHFRPQHDTEKGGLKEETPTFPQIKREAVWLERRAIGESNAFVRRSRNAQFNGRVPRATATLSRPPSGLKADRPESKPG